MFDDLPATLLHRARAVKLLILDVDGVLTSAQLFIGADGSVTKAFNTLDGHGIKMLRQSGVETAIITARDDGAVNERARQLGITHYYKGAHDKKAAYETLRADLGLAEEQCAFVGDDVIDLPVMVRCGFPVAVANAHEFVKQRAAWITGKAGGFGGVREVCDLIMHAQGSLNALLDGYTQ